MQGYNALVLCVLIVTVGVLLWRILGYVIEYHRKLTAFLLARQDEKALWVAKLAEKHGGNGGDKLKEEVENRLKSDYWKLQEGYICDDDDIKKFGTAEDIRI